MDMDEFDFENRIMSSEYSGEDTEVEPSLRPRSLEEYTGQEKATALFPQS